jgi:hypothetical protein
MALRMAAKPRKHTAAVESSHEHLKRAGDLKRKKRSRKSSVEPKVEYHMPVVTVGLENLTVKKGLSRARRTSWKYLVRAYGHLGMVDVLENRIVDTFQQLRIGPSAEKMFKRIKVLKKLPRLRRRNYRLQILRVPALQFSSLWLKGRARKQNVVVPLQSLSKELKIGRIYDEAKAESVLRVEAQRILSADHE